MLERVQNELGILERHLQVLEGVAEYEPVGLITLTNRLPYPRHKIQYSLRILEAEGLVQSTPEGVRTTDQTSRFHETTDAHLTTLAYTLEAVCTELQASAI